jgi:hypothetical protein
MLISFSLFHSKIGDGKSFSKTASTVNKGKQILTHLVCL